MFKFEELRVYQHSLTITELIYKDSSNWPKSELFGLTSQIRRSSTSIPLNIAEGTSRSKKDFKHFLDIARGSAFETVTVLEIAKRLGYISDIQYKQLRAELTQLIKGLHSLKSAIPTPPLPRTKN